MDKPDARTTACFERNLPADPRATRGQMFGHPCAFVHGNMFYGTFGQSLVLRVGEAGAGARVGGPLRIFSPMEGRAWKEYLQVDAEALPDPELASLAQQALEFTASLPPKVKKAARAKG